MLKMRREGFTLIELLIVVVIIGILAAIAIPKFSATRERAYFAAMQSDLKNLETQQEMYYSNNTYQYANVTSAAGLDFTPSQGVTVTIGATSKTGWYATASHSALAGTQTCAVAVGDSSMVSSASPATVLGVVTCTGE